MELIQQEIEAGADSVRLVWTPRWLLSPPAMEAILANPAKLMASVKITMINAEDKDPVIKNSILFGGKCQRADSFTEISANKLCVVSFHWGYITL